MRIEGDSAVSTADASARTVSPSLLGLSEFKLSVSAITGGAPRDPELITSGAYVDLVPGIYKVTITASKDGRVIAEGSSKSPVYITANDKIEVSITLDPKANDLEGTFEWDLAIPAGAVDPYLIITTLSGRQIDMIKLTAGDNNKNHLDLSPGYYMAQVVMTWGSSRPGFNSEFVHIYSGLTSLLKREFEPLIAQPVNKFVLTGYFPGPVIGETPKVKFEADQYIGSIQWKKPDGTDHTGPFAGNTVYSAVITLTANSGYTFQGVAANVFNHEIDGKKIPGTNSANSGVVEIVFPKATAEGTGGRIIEIVFNQGDIVVSGSNGKNAIYKGGTPSTLTLEVQGYEKVSWYVDADKVFLDNPLTLNADDYSIDSHTVTFTGYKGGIPLSEDIPFTVHGVIKLDNLDTGAGAMNYTVFDKLSQNPVESAVVTTSISLEAEGYQELTWVVDGSAKVSKDSDGNSIKSFTIKATDYTVGGHTLTLFVKDEDGIMWSQDLNFEIIP
jgi:hypothetical protein